MSADTLTHASRSFYERTKVKLVASVVIGAGALMLLGMCTSAGGLSSSNGYLKENANDDHITNSYEALVSGYGFACFLYIVAFIMVTAAGIYFSPLLCGSNNEKKMISSPQEIETGYTAYAEPSAPQV